MPKIQLLTDKIRLKLIENFMANKNRPERPHDFHPVVKLFFPAGTGTWLLTELNPDNNIAFGLADLGEPELGYFSVDEIASVRVRGLKVERDLYWKADRPLSGYVKLARERGSIQV